MVITVLYYIMSTGCDAAEDEFCVYDESRVVVLWSLKLDESTG